MNKEFIKRRKNLMRMMGEDAIAILPAAMVKTRNRDVDHDYRQDSDFLYATGFEEPEAVAVLIPGRGHGQYILFSRERNEEMETWHGRRAGQQGALDRYDADDAFPISDIDEILPGLLEQRQRVFYTMGMSAEFDQRVLAWLKQLRDGSRNGTQAPHELISLDYFMHEMRLFKSHMKLK